MTTHIASKKNRSSSTVGSDSSGKKKQVLIPYMCDNSYLLAATFRSQGIPAEVLPQTTDETMQLGREVCQGRECSPCFATTGDIVNRVRQQDFDPHNTMVFMPTSVGACRFGQYPILQREVLDRYNMHELEIVTTSSADAYQGMGDNPTRFRRIAWQGLISFDLLQKLVLEYRPYECNPGQTDEIYQQALQRLETAVENGGGKPVIETMEWLATQFEALPVDRSTRRPIIGLVGEFYLRFSTYSNLDLIRQIEASGGEVLLASTMEFIYYANWRMFKQAQLFKQPLEGLKVKLSDYYQQYKENEALKPIKHLLSWTHEASADEGIANLMPYYHHELESEALLTMGKAIDFIKNGSAGIINVMPFACMPGTITASIAPRIRADYNNVPWLDISYDTQGGTNIKTRLEAFMYQAEQFARQHPVNIHQHH